MRKSNHSLSKVPRTDLALHRPAAAEPRTPVPHTLELADLWQLIFRRRIPIFAVTAAIFLIALAYVLIKTPLYEGVARLQVDPTRSDNLGLDDKPVSTDLDTRVKTEVAILESNTVASQVMQSLRLYSNPQFAGSDAKPHADISQLSPAERQLLLERFTDNLIVKVLPNTQVVEIRFRSPDPALATIVANCLRLAASRWHAAQTTRLFAHARARLDAANFSSRRPQPRLSRLSQPCGCFGVAGHGRGKLMSHISRSALGAATAPVSARDFDRSRALAALNLSSSQRGGKWKFFLVVFLAFGVGSELFCRFVIGLGDPPLYQADPAMEYMLQPSKTYHRFHHRFSVNAYGMRADDFPLYKSSPKELRVLVVGDSVVYGGVRIDQPLIDTEILKRNLQHQYHRPVVAATLPPRAGDRPTNSPT